MEITVLTHLPARPPRLPDTPATRSSLLPLGALAAGFGLAMSPVMAQTQAPPAAASAASAPQGEPSAPAVTTLPQIKVKAAAERRGKDSYQTTTTRIGKGKQELRDVPQSVTVVTERLIKDRNLDTVKEALHNTAGISFMAAEGGEEDIRLRGFSLAATGDIFVDGMRDPAFYDRDNFNNDRLELLRGSASMLFGRGSTGGAVNQVNKLPTLSNDNEYSTAFGTGNYVRLVGDFNQRTGEASALRVNAMLTQADNYGNKIDKQGIAPTYRFGVGSADEFTVGLYHLQTRNGMNYGMPWVPPAIDTRGDRLLDVDPKTYFGMGSDYNAGSATYGTISHTHRFQDEGELRTTLRTGHYTRDQRASTIRIRPNNALPGVCQTPFVNGNSGARVAATYDPITDATQLCRGTNNKVQDMDTVYAQSDYSGKFRWLGVRHELLSGVDVAHERFQNYNVTPPSGTTLAKALTTIGTPADGALVNEGSRERALNREFDAKALGLYMQDLVQVAPSWKVLAGLRWDYFNGKYRTPATATIAEVNRSRHDSLWSKRFGLLFQPSATQSYHLSYGTSFNTSGDTYQYDNQTENTGPESSGNVELGTKIDSADGNFTVRAAIFRSTKYNERNRDPDSAATQNLLSGKRHSAGIELDLSGRLFKLWEIFGSYAWTPIAKIDVGAPGSTPGVGEGAGTRSSLTPRHSGTIWTTYQATPKFRVGGGLNARSSQTPNRNPVGIAAPRFITGDLMAEYKLSSEVTFKFNIDNVTNKLYADSLYTGHYIPGEGRSAQLGMSIKF
ncbi:MAG: TonB-dependent receptor [Cytophagales bacterium]|nr:TonB-dependent receptor [Rhizobacter sp.]